MKYKTHFLFLKKVFISAALVFVSFSCSCLFAADIVATHVSLRALDKVTGRFRTLESPVGEEIAFENLRIYPEVCLKKPPEETPEDMVFLTVYEQKPQGEEQAVFKGWMFSSNPALSPMEHPIYDVWVLECSVAEEAVEQNQNLPLSDVRDLPLDKEENSASVITAEEKSTAEQTNPIADAGENSVNDSKAVSVTGDVAADKNSVIDKNLVIDKKSEEKENLFEKENSSLPFSDSVSVEQDASQTEPYSSILPEEVIVQSLPEPAFD